MNKKELIEITMKDISDVTEKWKDTEVVSIEVPRGLQWRKNKYRNGIGTEWPEKNRQMSLKVAQKWFHKKKKISTTLQKLPKNVGDLGKLIVAKDLEKLPKVQ